MTTPYVQQSGVMQGPKYVHVNYFPLYGDRNHTPNPVAQMNLAFPVPQPGPDYLTQFLPSYTIKRKVAWPG